MTKFVLQSGNIKFVSSDVAHSFYHATVEGLGPSPKILLCFFGVPEDVWPNRFRRLERAFTEAMLKTDQPEFVLAKRFLFEEQAAACDVIYLYGGPTMRIMRTLERYNLPRIFTGKVVATNSSSSMALCTASWPCDLRRPMDGFDLIPIKYIAHYQSDYGSDDPRGPIDWNQAYQELQSYGNLSLPIYALKEGEYKVFEL